MEPTPSSPTPDNPERECQDSRWHDEEPEIVNDDLPRPVAAAPRRKTPRLPQVRRRYEED